MGHGTSRRAFLAGLGAAGGLALPGPRRIGAQARKRRKLVVGRQPLAASIAISRLMMDSQLLEKEAAAVGYEVTVDWRDLPNAGPIMELLKAGADSTSLAFLGNTPVVVGRRTATPSAR